MRMAPLTAKGAHTSTTVYFLTQAHADLAFETLRGKEKTDSFGNAQKVVYMNKQSAYVHVGKGKPASAHAN